MRLENSKWFRSSGIKLPDEIELMASLHKSDWIEELVRNAILIILACLGALYFGMIFPVVWIASYVGATLLMRLSLGKLVSERSFEAYLLTIVCFVCRLTSYRIMLLYLWNFPHPAAHYIGIFMLLAALSYSVSFKSRIRSYMIIHTVLDVAVLCIIAVEFLAFRPELEGAVLVSCAALGLIVFLCVMLHQHLVYLTRLEEAEKQHRQAQKMEAIGRLTGGVAHDFNNILTVVLGSLDLYDETSDPKERKALLETTRQAATRAAELTSQLLSFSRKSNLKQDLLHLSDIFAQIHRLTDRLLPANIILSTRIFPDTPPIRVDRTQLEVALINLIVNARDASPNGGTLELVGRKMPQEDGPDVVCICLTDQGEGIPPELIDKVIEPFFTTKAVGEGSGMGLSMVKGFAEQSGGYLRITSTPGASTTVTICLPAETSAS